MMTTEGFLRREPADRGGLHWAVAFLMGWVGSFFSSAPFETYYSLMFGIGGLLMLCCPARFSLPRSWWVMAGLFISGGALVFLPRDLWGEVPSWRSHLEGIGVVTGSRTVIQTGLAAEMWLVFGATLAFGLWLAGHRASPRQVRSFGTLFTAGVAFYAVLSELTRHADFIPRPEGHFGFFPNRNHSGTYLALGATVGLGSLLQACRERRVGAVLVSGLGAGICYWGVGVWSISRGGLLVAAIGGLAWLAGVGPSYLGRTGRRVTLLVMLAVAGAFICVDSAVKQRLSALSEATIGAANGQYSSPAQEASSSTEKLDGRIPIALDTFDLIRGQPMTGVGAGQFPYVAPLYRNRTQAVNDSMLLHPESDWLWMASEVGLPATLALLALIVSGSRHSYVEIRRGRDRAIRMACLVAGCTVAVHGIFDVPGHRLALAWTAAFLFALSLQPGSDIGGRPPNPWPSRLLGLAVLSLGIHFGWSAWGAGQHSFIQAADQEMVAAERVYFSALDRHDLAPGGAGRLLEARKLAEDYQARFPLDYRAYGLRGRIDLFFPDHFSDAADSFAIEAALTPRWIRIPLLQGTEWAEVDLTRSTAAWSEALRRAEAADRVDPAGHWLERTRHSLEAAGRAQPALMNAVQSALKSAEPERSNE